MYRNEFNERSPMRVFERTTRGGLGRGHVGVVMAPPGVGKTACLVQFALDVLLRGGRVLHITHEAAVDHVRAHYDEIFRELASSCRLEDADRVHLEMERGRLIFSHLGRAGAAPPSLRGGESSLAKIRETVEFARESAHFDPDVLILDGFDFKNANEEGVRELSAIARELSAEVWTSATVQLSGSAADAGAPPPPVDRFRHLLEVLVLLVPERDAVRLRLLQTHEGLSPADLQLLLDPVTMRLVDAEAHRLGGSDRPRLARRFRLHSGGARGAEAEFGACAEAWGMAEVNYSFEGHRMRERGRGVRVLEEQELRAGDVSLVYVSRRLGRVLSEIPLVRKVLQTIWHQVSHAQQVFVVGTIQADGTVRGGTGWGAELARLWKKPLHVFDQERRAWFRWSGTSWELATAPVITSEAFAGTGTQNLTPEGRQAIRDLFARSFGEP